MVLPPSTADHAAGPSRAWLSRIGRILALAGPRGGVLILITGAVPARLRELVLALDHHLRDDGRLPDRGLHVCLRAPEVMDVPEGATVLLRLDPDAHAADTGWLNEHRPLFAERRLRVLLWAEGEAAAALRRRAPDFFDWISHVIECPDAGVPAFALAGLRRAPAWPGVVWRGRNVDLDADLDLDAALAAAYPGVPVERMAASMPYPRLVEAARHASGWLVWTGVTTEQDLVRVRWAMAEAAGRSTSGSARFVVDNPACAAPGWWPVSDACTSWIEAADMLARHGIEDAALLAALVELEPDALRLVIELAPFDVLARHRVGEARASVLDRLRALGPEDDAGACLARAIADHDLVRPERVARMDEKLPVLRAFRDDAEVDAYRRAVCAWVDGLLRAWAEQAAKQAGLPPWTVNTGEIVVWADARPAQPPRLPDPCPAHPAAAYWLEAVIAAAGTVPGTDAQTVDSAMDWGAAVNLALWIGQYDVAGHWAESHEMSAPVRAGALFQQGRFGEAEALLRLALAAGGAAHQSQLRVLLAATLAEQGKHGEAEAILRRIVDRDGDRDRVAEARTASSTANQEAAALGGVGTPPRPQAEGRGRTGGTPPRQPAPAMPRGQADSASLSGVSPGSALHLLAEVLAAQGKLAEADDLLRQSVAQIERTRGADDPLLGIGLHALAAVLQRQGKLAQAEERARQALDSKQHTHGPAHPSYAASLELLAGILAAQGRSAEAEDLYRRSIDIELDIESRRGDTPGTSHARRARARSELGQVLGKQGKYDEAEQLLRQTLDSAGAALGPSHPVHVATQRELAALLMERGEYAQAEALLRQTLGAQERAYYDGAQEGAPGDDAHDDDAQERAPGDDAEAQERAPRGDALELALTLARLAQVVARQGRGAEARALAGRARAAADFTVDVSAGAGDSAAARPPHPIATEIAALLDGL